ncbi:hypothetical protein ACFWN1_17385 [Streptomyces sp. NPDC058459]|uniref:hypothetical protein n=1 Tax=Streptomyces sp. NPDC058459 TaxID=3346508 RepID=UPI0036559736
MPLETGFGGEEPEDAGLKPPPGAALEDAVVLDVDAVLAVEVGLDKRPQAEKVVPAQVRG